VGQDHMFARRRRRRKEGLQATRKPLVSSVNIYYHQPKERIHAWTKHALRDEPLTRAAMAVQSSTPNFPPLLKRAHIRKAISRGQRTTKTADGMYTRYALLSFGSSAGAAFSDMLARPAALLLLVLLTREASSLEKVTLSYLQGTRTRQTREGMGARYLALRLPTLAVMRPLVPKEESCSACSIHCAQNGN